MSTFFDAIAFRTMHHVCDGVFWVYSGQLHRCHKVEQRPSNIKGIEHNVEANMLATANANKDWLDKPSMPNKCIAPQMHQTMQRSSWYSSKALAHAHKVAQRGVCMSIRCEAQRLWPMSMKWLRGECACPSHIGSEALAQVHKVAQRACA